MANADQAAIVDRYKQYVFPAVVPLFDPSYFSTGRTALRFNNLALIFLEPQLDRHAPVAGRFIYFVRGTGQPDPNSGSLIKTIKLVE